MKKNVFYLIGIIFLMVSCYPGEIDSYEETDLVFTNYTESFDFAGQGTYSMPDKIVKITGNLTEGETPEYVQEPYNTSVLSRIESNMTALGWTKVADPADADLPRACASPQAQRPRTDPHTDAGQGSGLVSPSRSA